jgi:hypothetical protein
MGALAGRDLPAEASLRWTCALLVASLGALIAVPLLAGARTPLRDPNDTTGPLDVRRVVVKTAGAKPVWRIETGPRWTVRSLRDRGYVLVFLDTFGTQRPDYYALIRSDGRRLRGSLLRDRVGKRDRHVSWLDVWRKDRSSVSLRVPLRKSRVGKRRDAYSWSVQTLMTTPRCRRICFDGVPNRGTVEEPLRPAPAPSPSSSV